MGLSKQFDCMVSVGNGGMFNVKVTTIRQREPNPYDIP